MAKTGIILVMYNQKHNLDMLYSSLYEQTEKDFKIYFVDNNPGGSDSVYSAELNKKYSLNIEYISPAENSGFAGGNNFGAQKAIDDNCRYIFFLNNDTILDSGCINELIKSVESDISIAASSPLIFYWSGSKIKGRVQEFGSIADFNSYKINKLYENTDYKKNESIIPESIIVNLLSGAATFIKAGVLQKTGLWEESYFAYGDEIDLARRINEAGYKCIVNKHAVLWHNHKWDKDNKKGFYFEYYLIQRNKYLYFRKYSLYGRLILSFLADNFLFPYRLIWFVKVCGFKLGYCYLKGTYAGILGHSGRPNLNY